MGVRALGLGGDACVGYVPNPLPLPIVTPSDGPKMNLARDVFNRDNLRRCRHVDYIRMIYFGGVERSRIDIL